MPFTERVPLSDRFPPLSKLAIDFGARDMNLGVGTEATTFSFRDQQREPVTVAAAICYEQLYPATMAALVRQGAEMLARLTNEGWFSQSHGLYQLAAFTRLRAMEVRRTIARCTNTGLTCFIDPLGRLSEPAPWWSEQTVVGTSQAVQGTHRVRALQGLFPESLPVAGAGAGRGRTRSKSVAVCCPSPVVRCSWPRTTD